jgi:hypothetical protein
MAGRGQLRTAVDSLVQMAPQTPQSHRVAMTALWLRPEASISRL